MGLATRLDTLVPASAKGTWHTREGINVSVECGDITTYTVRN